MTTTISRSKLKPLSLKSVQSLKVIKNTVRTGISCILYLRSFFGEDEFGEQRLGDLKLKNLKPVSRESAYLDTLLEKGVFDALEKEYLKSIIFSIHDQQKNVVEKYHFEICGDVISESTMSRSGKETNEQQASKEEMTAIEDAVKSLLTNLLRMTQALGPLPPTRHFSILLKYNDKAPQGYEPTAFTRYEESDVAHFATDPITENFGKVKTGKHVFGVQIESSLLGEVPDDLYLKRARESLGNLSTEAEEDSSQLASDESSQCSSNDESCSKRRRTTTIMSDGISPDSCGERSQECVRDDLINEAREAAESYPYLSVKVLSMALGYTNTDLNRGLIKELQIMGLLEKRNVRNKGYKSLIYKPKLNDYISNRTKGKK